MASTRRSVRPDTSPALAPGSPNLRQMVGQKLMVAMRGTSPSADLLGRIRRGEVGGVILFGANIASAPQLVRLTRQLQQAATAGGRPPLLIATDQEGGGVKRLSWAPPTLSPPQMGAIGSATTAASQGKATGRRAGLRGHQQQPGARGRRAVVDGLVHVPGRPHVLVRRNGDGQSEQCLRVGAGGQGRPAGHEALPGAWLRHAQHRYERGHDPCVGDRAWGPDCVPTGRRSAGTCR